MPRGASCSKAAASIMDRGCRKEVIPNETLWRHLSLVSLMRKTLRSHSAGGMETDRAQGGVGWDVGQKQKETLPSDCYSRDFQIVAHLLVSYMLQNASQVLSQQ